MAPYSAAFPLFFVHILELGEAPRQDRTNTPRSCTPGGPLLVVDSLPVVGHKPAVVSVAIGSTGEGGIGVHPTHSLHIQYRYYRRWAHCMFSDLRGKSIILTFL